MNDTPIEVAMEMVEELEITDWDPQEIAEMIEAEISILVPHWKNWVSSSRLEPSHSYDYHEDDFDGSHHLYRSSSCSSSVASASGVFLSNDRLQGFLLAYYRNIVLVSFPYYRDINPIILQIRISRMK